MEWYRRTKESIGSLTEDYEIIFVNDGSEDNSLDIVQSLIRENHRIKVIDLSRNFGHHEAMMTGLNFAKGDYIFLIDSDLEEQPEWLLSFKEQMEKSKCDVVYGVQAKRKGGFIERYGGKAFDYFFRFCTGFGLPAAVVTARLMTKSYVNALLKYKERELFLLGIWHLTGFYQEPQVVKKLSCSETTYSFGLRLQLMINAITSFSNRPLMGIFYFGLFLSVGAFASGLYLLINKLFGSEIPVLGWTSVMISIWLLSGLIILFLGVIGIYLSKVFSESKQRPLTIVRQIYGGDEK